MSGDVFAVHSSEFDAQPAEGWYIVVAYADDGITTDDVVSGPYQTYDMVNRAIAGGYWLRRVATLPKG